MSDDDDYVVGYGKPPRHTQFKKGRSGNPQGRRKGQLNLKTDLEAELRQRVRVTENGKPISLTKQQLILKTLVARASKGDARASGQVLDLVTRVIGVGVEVEEHAPALPDDDAVILAAMAKDLARVSGEGEE